MIADFIIIDKDKTCYRLNHTLHDAFINNIVAASTRASFVRKNKTNVQLLAYIKDFLNNDSNNFVLIDQYKNTLVVPNNDYIKYMLDELPKLEHKNYNQLDKSIRSFLKGLIGDY